MQKILLLILTGLTIGLKSTIYANDTPASPDAYKVHHTSSGFSLCQPILYISMPDEILFMNKQVPAKVSIGNLRETDRVLTYTSIWGYGKPLPGYRYLGLLDDGPSRINIQLKTPIGELIFDEDFQDLVQRSNSVKRGIKAYYLIIDSLSSNNKKYMLNIVFHKKHHVLVKLNPADLLPTLIPCWYILMGNEVIEVDKSVASQPLIRVEPDSDPETDDLFDEITTKEYVIVAGDVGPGGKGLNLGGKIVTLALSPHGEDKPIINPENASEIEPRIRDLYKGYKALGFARGRDLLVMVDGKVTERRSNFSDFDVGESLDFAIGDKHEKLFIFIRKLLVPFKTKPFSSDIMGTHMYVIYMYNIDHPGLD